MAPIRVGFIGLSSGQSWAVWAHLPYLKNTSKYEIVALCNSSVESAQAAIKAHGLPSSVKAYGSSEDLAADSNVQLVVCCIRVDKHYDTVMPALKAGKDVFCEWPLAKDSMQAEEMTALAKDKGVRTFVGLQSPFSPLLQKIKQIIDSEKVGKVLSSTLYGTPTFFGATQLEATAYMEDIKVGGNMVSIYAMHCKSVCYFAVGQVLT
jgi:predicted dehydrogenase